MPVHPIAPVVPPDAEILILGSFPSVRSRQEGFYYAHPQNRFWKVLAALYGEDVPETVGDKTAFLFRHRIALWDVIGSCEIEGSSDAKIRNAVPNDIAALVRTAPIRHVFLNGSASGAYYRRYTEKTVDIPATVLPSTSPANAAWTLPRLIGEWRVVTKRKEEDNDPI